MERPGRIYGQQRLQIAWKIEHSFHGHKNIDQIQVSWRKVCIPNFPRISSRSVLPPNNILIHIRGTQTKKTSSPPLPPPSLASPPLSPHYTYPGSPAANSETDACSSTWPGSRRTSPHTRDSAAGPWSWWSGTRSTLRRCRRSGRRVEGSSGRYRSRRRSRRGGLRGRGTRGVFGRGSCGCGRSRVPAVAGEGVNSWGFQMGREVGRGRGLYQLSH